MKLISFMFMQRLKNFCQYKETTQTSFKKVLPFSILIATVVSPDLNGSSIAVPLATWPKAPLPIIFSTVTLFFATSQERVRGSRGAYSAVGEGLCDWRVRFCRSMYVAPAIVSCWVDLLVPRWLALTSSISSSFWKWKDVYRLRLVWSLICWCWTLNNVHLASHQSCFSITKNVRILRSNCIMVWNNNQSTAQTTFQ